MPQSIAWGVQNRITGHWLYGAWLFRPDGRRRTLSFAQCLRYCRALNRRHGELLFVVDVLPQSERGDE